MKWIGLTIGLYLLWRWLNRKPKPVTVEEFNEPPEEFVSYSGLPKRPPALSASAAKEQRQFDSSGIDEHLL